MTGTQQRQWLRHYFKYCDSEVWSPKTQIRTPDGDTKEVKVDPPPPVNIDPYSSQLITDFLAYNTTRFCFRRDLYDDKGKLSPEISSTDRAFDVLPSYKFRFLGLNGLAQDGVHWVGDLAAEYDIDVRGTTGTVSLDLVEFGIHYVCDIDVATGKASLQAMDQGKPLNVFADEPNSALVTPTATTSIRGTGRHRVRMANIDDQIFLWVDGSLVSFDHSTEYDSHKFRAAEARRPYWSPADPLDAAPIAIGASGVNLAVERAQVWRDIYYIAVRDQDTFSDYIGSDVSKLVNSIKDPQLKNQIRAEPNEVLSFIAWTYANPETWSESQLFSKRGVLNFQLEEGQFFPMGDNSAASSDARVWYRHPFVERRFLIGKALLVFWPHLWYGPVPHPNLPRMGRIR